MASHWTPSLWNITLVRHQEGFSLQTTELLECRNKKERLFYGFTELRSTLVHDLTTKHVGLSWLSTPVVFQLLQGENVLVEVFLEFLVGIVDVKLLEAIHLKVQRHI